MQVQIKRTHDNIDNPTFNQRHLQYGFAPPPTPSATPNSAVYDSYCFLTVFFITNLHRTLPSLKIALNFYLFNYYKFNQK